MGGLLLHVWLLHQSKTEPRSYQLPRENHFPTMTSGSITARNLTEENKIFFKYLTLKALLLRRLTKSSEHAADYELRNAHTTLVQTIGDKILASKDWSGVAWDEDSTRMLDYACGTGLISRVRFPL